MPRYLVERTCPSVRTLPLERVIDLIEDDGVSWLHSYMSVDARTMVCVYDAPSPEAIRKAARRSDLPVDRITQVRVLDPYAYDLRRQR